jgi:hypothetical protein
MSRKNFILARGEKILPQGQVNPATQGGQLSSLQSEAPYHPTATNIRAKRISENKKKKKRKCRARQKVRASPSINTENQVFEIPNATGIPSHGIIMRGS